MNKEEREQRLGLLERRIAYCKAERHKRAMEISRLTETIDTSQAELDRLLEENDEG